MPSLSIIKKAQFRRFADFLGYSFALSAIQYFSAPAFRLGNVQLTMKKRFLFLRLSS